MSWYITGTVTCTNGSKSIVGVGTNWTASVNTGDSFSLSDTNGAAIAPFYEIAGITDDTHLKLRQSYSGSPVSGVAYCITNHAAEQTSAALDRDVNALLNRLETSVAAAEKAKEWAVKMDGKVDNDDYSAKYYAAEAATDAATAQAAQTAAETAQGAAETAVQAAENAKSAAQTSATGAANSATTATTAKNDAVTAKNAAESAQTAAQTNATNAAASAAQAANSAAQVPIASLLAAAGQVPKAGTDSKIDIGWLPATATPTALGIPVADANGDIDSGWLKDASATVKGVVELATPEEVLAGTDNERVVTAKDLDYSYATIDSDRIYEGVDLETKFATEIAGYSDVWAWIKARITAVDYSGLHVGDYIPFSMGGMAIKAQIAGIDTYYRTGDVEIGHHIDFISKDCNPIPMQWNTTNNNNGSAANAAPWMVSNIRSILNSTWYSYLPAALQAQIIEKRAYIETRYTSGSTLTDSTGAAWNDIGKLWVPSEFEVFGGIVWGTRGYSQNGSVQYPIFVGNSEKRIKNQGDGGERCYWWLSSVTSGVSTHVCFVGNDGLASYGIASVATIYVPVCFRIG